MNRYALFAVPFFGFACDKLPDEVLLSGRILDAPDGQGTEVASATVTTRDPDAAKLGDDTTDENGEFEVPIPVNEHFFVAISADGYTTTSFTGFAAEEDILADQGELWIKSNDETEALRAEFSECPTAAAEGGIVYGEVRLYIPTSEEETEELPYVTTATVLVTDVNGDTAAGCYLDDDGISTADTTVTGYTGRFAVFATGEGIMQVDVAYTMDELEGPTSTYYFHMPENGIVPLAPAYVQLP